MKNHPRCPTFSLRSPRVRQAVTVYHREGCHLCEDLLRALEPLRLQLGFQVEIVDIDRQRELYDRYNERVPVVAVGDTEVCEYFLDEPALRRILTG